MGYDLLYVMINENIIKIINRHIANVIPIIAFILFFLLIFKVFITISLELYTKFSFGISSPFINSLTDILYFCKNNFFSSIVSSFSSLYISLSMRQNLFCGWA